MYHCGFFIRNHDGFKRQWNGIKELKEKILNLEYYLHQISHKNEGEQRSLFNSKNLLPAELYYQKKKNADGSFSAWSKMIPEGSSDL